GDYTFVAGDGGVHTFAAGGTLVTSGPQTITATDTPGNTVTGSAPISVNPAPVTHFSISALTSTNAGSAFTITVTALDVFNNPVTGYTGTVHFRSSDTAGVPLVVLPVNYHFVSGDHGVHTFISGVTLVTAGSRSVTVTDTSASSLTGSASISVQALNATK